MTTINLKKLDPNAKVPTFGSEFAAGFDLYACNREPITIPAGKTVLIHTGLAMEIPVGYGGFVYARSGLATKKGLAPANKVGVIDADYRGEIMVALHNHSHEDRQIDAGERIAQMVIAPFLKVDFNETEELADTMRGTGGFGSTGNK
ncbi:MAG: dUTP diphosphatase [Bacillota bacterium]|jgi:dUTP pyrophosphatase